MKTLNSNLNQSLEAFSVTCVNCESASRSRGVMSDADVEHVERKLSRIIKSLNGSRYIDVSNEIRSLADVIDMSGRNQ